MYLHQRPLNTTNLKNPEIIRTTIYHIHKRITMSGQWISFDVRCAVLKGYHTTFDQLLNFILQWIEILDVMAGFPLMKSTVLIGLVPLW